MAISSTSPLINTGSENRFLQRRAAPRDGGEGATTQLMPIKSGPVRLPDETSAATTKVNTSKLDNTTKLAPTKVSLETTLAEVRGPKQPIKVPYSEPVSADPGVEQPISLPPLEEAASRSAGSFVNLKA